MGLGALNPSCRLLDLGSSLCLETRFPVDDIRGQSMVRRVLVMLCRY